VNPNCGACRASSASLDSHISFLLNTTEAHPKINWRRFLFNQGIATSVRSKPAAINSGLCARFWKRTWISWSVTDG
jgi:hypothetical protein